MALYTPVAQWNAPPSTHLVNPPQGGGAASGYQFGILGVPNPQSSAPSGVSPYTQTGGAGLPPNYGGTPFSPQWAASQTVGNYAQGQGALQGAANQISPVLQYAMQLLGNPQGAQNLDAQKAEAAGINAGATNSALQGSAEAANARGMTGPGVAAQQAEIQNQGGANLQSAYTNINTANNQQQQQQQQMAASLVSSLLGLNANIAGNQAQLGQAQQNPILAPNQRPGGGGQANSSGNLNSQQVTGGGVGAQRQDPVKLARYTDLYNRYATLTGGERIEWMLLKGDLGL